MGTEAYDEKKTQYSRMKSQKPHLSSLSAFSHVPLERKNPKTLSYFYQENKEDCVPAYDSIFKRSECYNEKLHRDDRAHAKHKGLDLHNEETSRLVPVLSSSEYGRHLHLSVDKVNRDHVRVGVVRLEFFRKSGMSKSLEEGYGCVTPS